MSIIDKPWGSYEVLCEERYYKVKRIIINPDMRISLQYHKHRNEHWFITEGTGQVTIDRREFNVNPGDSVDILKNQHHRIKNLHNTQILVFIEVQTGDYLGEEDIVRIQDDFHRN